MISRATALAVVFATFATASIALAAGTHGPARADTRSAATAPAVRIIELPRVVVVAKRLPA